MNCSKFAQKYCMELDKKYCYSIELDVRDYEIDSEGIVNNANYLHYLEHARHRFCDHAGFSFKAMQDAGLIPVLNRVEVDYKTPLRSGDRMVIAIWVEMKGVRFVFHQDIFNAATGEMVISAVVSCVCLKDGKLSRGELLAEKFQPYLK